MTTRINTTLAAALLAVGVLVGAAGTIVVRDATTNGVTGYMGGRAASAGSMGNLAGMMTMMGAGGAAGMMGGGGAGMMGGGQMGPNASMTPGEHGTHHSPRGTVPSR